MLVDNDVLIPATFDPIFKALLVSNETKEYLAKLLSGITGIDFEIIMNESRIINSEMLVNNYKNKILRTDILIVIGNSYLNLEMNNKYYKGLVERNNIYQSRIVSQMIETGDNYIEAPICIQINFDNFRVFNNKKIINECYFKNEDNEIESKNIIKYHINLEELKKKCYDNIKLTYIERIFAMLVIDSKELGKNLVEGDEILEKALDKLSNLSSNEEFVVKWDYERDAQMIQNSIILDAKMQGMEQGMEKGIEQGIKNIVKKLKANGTDIDLICKVSGLSKEEVLKI